MKLSDTMYSILKWTALVALNAIGVLYSTLASVWKLPFGDEVAKTCSALALCIGALIGVSSATYYKDKAEKTEEPEE